MHEPWQKTSDYVALIRRMLPSGPAWDVVKGSRWYSVIRVIAEEFRLLHYFLFDIERESRPHTTTKLIPEFEDMLGLPEPCTGAPPTSLLERRGAVLEKFTRKGQPTKDFMLAQLDKFGYGAVINDKNDDATLSNHTVRIYLLNVSREYMTTTSYANARLSTWANTQAECLIRRLLSAHIAPIFSYVNPPTSSELRHVWWRLADRSIPKDAEYSLEYPQRGLWNPLTPRYYRFDRDDDLTFSYTITPGTVSVDSIRQTFIFSGGHRRTSVYVTVARWKEGDPLTQTFRLTLRDKLGREYTAQATVTRT